MESGLRQPDYDYTVYDGKGRRGVKNGVEYPINEEEWQRMHPKHSESGCTECSFVSDAGTLLAFLVPREVRDRAGDKPEFVGKFTMPGWTGHSGFYVFRCPECDEVRVDYPHGYCENGCLYIYCDKCRFRIVFYPGKFREVYQRENVVAPPTLLEELKSFWNNRKKFKEMQKTAAEIEDKHGVRVLVSEKEQAEAPSLARILGFRFFLVLLALFLSLIAYLKP